VAAESEVLVEIEAVAQRSFRVAFKNRTMGPLE